MVHIDKPDHHVPELTHPLMESVEAAFHVPVECVRSSKSAVGCVLLGIDGPANCITTHHRLCLDWQLACRHRKRYTKY